MFRNRHAEVRFVKDEKLPQPAAPNTTPTEYVQLARETGKDVVKGAAVLIATFVTADTFRRCVVHIVATKIQ